MDIFVFKENCLVGLFIFFIRDAISNRVRINLAAAALVHPLLKEHGVLVGNLFRVSRNPDSLFPRSHTVVFRPRHVRISCGSNNKQFRLITARIDGKPFRDRAAVYVNVRISD